MNRLVPVRSGLAVLPAVAVAAGEWVGLRFLDPLAVANNPNTNRAYGRAAIENTI